ncbi:MAG: MraY family glycosyltransferase [Verrucomicrobiota bacterium]|nr:MraY family glycosyltransferase [Verrucomicrobiota bacterium]
MIKVIALTFFAFGITLLLVPFVRIWAIRRRLVDRPDRGRKTHRKPVPRVGGLAIFMSFLVILLGMSYLRNNHLDIEVLSLALSSSLMFVVGFWDDIRPLGAKVKLVLQILVSVVAFLLGIRIEMLFGHSIGFLSLPLTIIWLVSTVNIINLIDGIDGLAAGVCIFLMITLGILASNTEPLTLICFGMVGVLGGFLFYNFPPARIFLGDGGAYFLGFLIGSIALVNSRKGEVALALIAPFLALGLPVLDTALAIIRRGMRGLPLFFGDREHIHHRLVDIGFSTRRVILILYSACGLLSFSAMLVFWTQGRLLPLFIGISLLSILVLVRQLGYIKSYASLGAQIIRSLGRRRESKAAQEQMMFWRQKSIVAGSSFDPWKHFEIVLARLEVEKFEFHSFDPEMSENYRWDELVPHALEEELINKGQIYTCVKAIKINAAVIGEIYMSKHVDKDDIAHFERITGFVAESLKDYFADKRNHFKSSAIKVHRNH